MTTTAATRLPAAERRQAFLEAALRVFAEGSYRGTTTAEIAREAGVSEPILYRHFPCKRDLYLACIEESWRLLREVWETTIAESANAREWLPKMSGAYVALKDTKHLVAELWMQAVVEAGDDAVVQRFLRGHMREVHDFIADVIRRCQEQGVVRPERDADAEAWVFLAGGLLGTIGRRLGGLLGEEDFERIRSSRREWMTGTPPDARSSHPPKAGA
jgi:TetR/AcrR family transcriptional regulator